ncbi:hypothetical protein M409DRAFT_53259 [Zasmidium cellare ATCC 36951]|uniref:Major facilitator superfamily (MFS) profile domain-containing protein n=1 Tax=Zasmidium cellare ATCC 36951 TaxID=1080233 RepID=A0A6A6CNI9_ZASCE|nr:uncharacterized protein M409DRAFT_53259 [Zasmidium cellare ATCC 36951]KAF2168611.1 hypothetical protein M409DRAFT_53259 [Zasmidium cellare ATCC 36951]
MASPKGAPSSQPFPLAQLLIVGLCRCSQPFAIASLLPYLPSYLENLSIPTTSIATYQGAFLATLGICESTFAIPWTRLADRIGRKPVIVATLITQLLGNLALGFCTQTWQAFACMIVIGISNGNVAVMRAIVAEMVTAKEHQARAFSFTPMASAAGTLLGSLSGGWLSGVRLGSGWPVFVLPTLVSAIVFLPAVGSAIFMLEETGRVKLGYEKVSLSASKDIDDEEDSDSIELDDAQKKDPDLEDQRRPSTHEDRQPPTNRTTFFQIVRNPFIWLNALVALHSVGSDNMLPLVLQYPSSRPTTTSPLTSLFTTTYGYGTTPRFTGLLFSAACVSAMVVSSTIYPRLAKTKSHSKILLGTLLAYPLIYFTFPFTLLPTSQLLSLSTLTLLFLLKGGVFICALQASMICLTNSVEKENVALAHGVNFTLGGLGRGLGSALVGGLFEIGLRWGAIVVPFWGLAAISGGIALGSLVVKGLR